MTVDISSVPETLGVYAWKNKYNKVIYIGKTKNLKAIMNQYLTGNLSPRNKVLLGNIDSFEIYECKTELEALKLEQEMIEQNDPIFNIKIRSTRIYPYIEVKKGKNLKLSVSKTKKVSNSTFFGPFPNGKTARDIIELWRVIFNTDEIVDRERQKETLKKMEVFFSGGNEFAYDLINKSDSNNKEYLIDLVKSSNDKVEVLFKDKRNFDVFNFFVYDDLISVTITYIRNGIKGISANIINKMFAPLPEDAMIAFLSRYYSRNIVPDYVLIPFQSNWNINVGSPIRIPNNKVEYDLMNETLLSAESELMGTPEQFLNRIKEYAYAIEFMRKNFDTKSSTKIIEMMKITDLVGYKLVTVAQYLDGQPRLKGFKKYIINSESDINEAIDLHLKTIKEKHLIEPDVLILENESEMNKAINVFKSDNSKSLIAISTNGIIIDSIINDEGDKIDIEFKSHIYNFISTIARELDKFSKGYHKSRTNNIILEAKLDNYKFLNEIDKQRLFKTFKSYKRIMSATSEELGKVLARSKALKLLKEKGENNG